MYGLGKKDPNMLDKIIRREETYENIDAHRKDLFNSKQHLFFVTQSIGTKCCGILHNPLR